VCSVISGANSFFACGPATLVLRAVSPENPVLVATKPCHVLSLHFLNLHTIHHHGLVRAVRAVAGYV
jgi:hypothetical protein